MPSPTALSVHKLRAETTQTCRFGLSRVVGSVTLVLALFAFLLSPAKVGKL